MNITERGELFNQICAHCGLSDAEAADLIDEFVRELAASQKAFFGDISAQGIDGNWYSVSDWLMGVES